MRINNSVTSPSSRRLPRWVWWFAGILSIASVVVTWFGLQATTRVVISGRIVAPNIEPGGPGDVPVVIWSLKTDEDISKFRKLNQELQEGRIASGREFWHIFYEYKFTKEASMKIKDSRFKASVEPGVKIITIFSKGYFWAEMFSAEQDVGIEFNESAIIRW